MSKDFKYTNYLNLSEKQTLDFLDEFKDNINNKFNDMVEKRLNITPEQQVLVMKYNYVAFHDGKQKIVIEEKQPK